MWAPILCLSNQICRWKRVGKGFTSSEAPFSPVSSLVRQVMVVSQVVFLTVCHYWDVACERSASAVVIEGVWHINVHSHTHFTSLLFLQISRCLVSGLTAPLTTKVIVLMGAWLWCHPALPMVSSSHKRSRVSVKVKILLPCCCS